MAIRQDVRPSTAAEPERSTLDRLATKTYDELEAIYRSAPAPVSVVSVVSMGALDGEMIGRMLAVRYARWRPLAAGMRALAAWKRFPWAGKSFSVKGKGEGGGINRIRLLGSHDLFPFETSLGPSAVDGKSCVVLDYDLARNPGPIRRIRDELREVSPGTFLGPAMWKAASGPKLLLWFAVAARGA